MSRVYEALQRSQGDKPNASPLVSASPKHLPRKPPPLVPAMSLLPAFPQLRWPFPQPCRPSLRVVTTDGKWLQVPADRVLHPHPTPEQRLVSIAEPDSPGAEMFRVLSTRLAHMQRKRRLQKLLITSSEGDEGKSVLAVNLALALAAVPTSVRLLIEADLRRPTASSLLATSSLPGIAEWSEGKLAAGGFAVPGQRPAFLVPSRRPGHGRAHASAGIGPFCARCWRPSPRASIGCCWMRTPMLPMADSTSLSRLCDGVLVVVREGHTRRRVLNKALESIEKSKLLGTVLNEASMLKVGYDRYYGSNGNRK